eukprot:11103538-Ditylum_brightwellii.AAC.1
MKVAVKWNGTMNAKDPLDFVIIFDKNGTSLEKVREYVNLVWAMVGQGADTPNYSKKYGATEPADTPALEAGRNMRRLKHLMLGKLLWNSFLSNFQLKILTEEHTFKRGRDHIGMLLWQHLIDHANPLTCVLVGNLKDKLEMATLVDFDQDIKVFNT